MHHLVGNSVRTRNHILLRDHAFRYLEANLRNGDVSLLSSRLDGVLHHWICDRLGHYRYPSTGCK